MFKKIGMITVLSIAWSIEAQTCLQKIAIPVKDFCNGNSLLIITRGNDGNEQISRCMSCDEGKIEYSQEDILLHSMTLNSIEEQSQAIVSNVQQADMSSQDNEAFMYLYFEVDTELDIIRILVIKNNLLADNPFDIKNYSNPSAYTDEDDDDDWGDFDSGSDDLPVVDENTLVPDPIELTYYQTAVLTYYAAHEYASVQVNQTYETVVEWFKSKYAE